VVDTVPVLAVLVGMYHTGTYTDIKTLTFHTDLNTGRTGYTGQFRALPARTERTSFLVL